MTGKESVVYSVCISVLLQGDSTGGRTRVPVKGSGRSLPQVRDSKLWLVLTKGGGASKKRKEAWLSISVTMVPLF
jgi:hypothetical protein